MSIWFAFRRSHLRILLVLVGVVVLGCFFGWLVQANLSPMAFSIEQTAEDDDDDED